MACADTYQKPMYTKRQVCGLLRQHGINIDDVDQPFEIVDLAKKYNTDRQRKYMQFKRENDPEFMGRIKDRAANISNETKQRLLNNKSRNARTTPNITKK